MPVLSRQLVKVCAKMACRYLKEGERADALEWLGSIIKVGHDVLNMECQAKFNCQLKVCRLDDRKEEVPWIGCQECSHIVSQLDLFKCCPVIAAAHT
ncbi:hypothetical protein GOBAR_AA27561 [Gossypium barbadense]|uniref:Uncharacterized protein n=1 Tax=Gossypium barbadense TaxID=3634 RepID=A0A2P5WPZ1_GOSBA|nr:hypothetical protein GOBAR_AA27561 [Gossypium barbadense]